MLSFLHSFPSFLIARPQLPEMAAGAVSCWGESRSGHQGGMSPPGARVQAPLATESRANQDSGSSPANPRKPTTPMTSAHVLPGTLLVQPQPLPWPEAALHPTVLRTWTAARLSSASHCFPRHAPACSHAGGWPAGAFGEANGGFRKGQRANRGAVGRGKVASLHTQAAGLLLSFSTC